MEIFFFFKKVSDLKKEKKKTFFEVMRLDYIITSTYTMHRPI